MHHPKNTWQLQQAKQCFSEVVKRAENNAPQQITKNGEESVWIISAKEYHRLTDRKKKPSLLELFQNSPHSDIEIIQRRKDLPRKFEL